MDYHYSPSPCQKACAQNTSSSGEPVCTYPARIFVKYELMYLNVCAKKYVQVRTTYVHTYVQDTSLYVCDTDMSVSHTDMSVSHTNISVSHTYRKYLIVFACICTYYGKWLLAHAARAHLLARIRLRAGEWSLQFACAQAHGRRAVATAILSCGQRRCRQIINRFIWIRPARLDSSSWRQLKQQQICCALKCLVAVGRQWSTSRRQRKNIDEQNDNSSRSIRRPPLRKRSWIS
jgi:hypothetical protein